MAVNDRFQLVLTTSYRGALFNNVFGYKQTAGSNAAAAQQLTDAFENSVWPAIRAFLQTTCLAVSLSSINVDNQADYYLLGAAGFTTPDGVRTGGESNTFMAFGFVMPRTTRAVRNGAKRFGGISDNDIDGGVATAGVYPALAAAATAMGDTITSTGSNTYQPRIMRRIRTGTAPNYVYEYQDWPMGTPYYRRVTTQNSRKG